jgi:hypothetical protein
MPIMGEVFLVFFLFRSFLFLSVICFSPSLQDVKKGKYLGVIYLPGLALHAKPDDRVRFSRKKKRTPITAFFRRQHSVCLLL